MERSLKLIEDYRGATKAVLPLSATPEDMREIVRLLKSKPQGITLGGATEGVFAPEKVAAYEMLEIVSRSGNRIRLTSLGREFARRLEGAAQIFRFIVGSREPYRALLGRAHERRAHVLRPDDVAAHLAERYPSFFERGGQGAVEPMALCFFRLCQAAGLGTVFGQTPVRLHIDLDELGAHIAGGLARPADVPSEQAGARADTLRMADLRAPETRLKAGVACTRTAALRVLSHGIAREIEALSAEESAGEARRLNFAEEVRRFEAELIRGALAQTGGRQRPAARLLCMSKTVLHSKIKRYNIAVE